RQDGSLGPLVERPSERAARTRQPVRKMVLAFTRPDATRRWVQVDAVPLLGADGKLTRVVCSLIDITEQKSSEEALRRRDAILEAVAFAAETLLTATEWEHSIDAVLGHLGAATGVSRVYIVPARDPGSGLPEARTYEWTAPGIAPHADLPAHGSYLESVGLRAWESILSDGGIVEGGLGTFPAAEQAILAALGVCSLVLVPIFAGSTWWGFIGFDDCVGERIWPVSAVEALKTAAGTLGAAILRRRAEVERLQLVREQSARVEAEAAQRRLAFLADASQILAASLDYEMSLQDVAELLVPDLADACFIDIAEPDGSTRRVATAMSTTFSDAAVDVPLATVLQTGQAWSHATALSVPLVTRSGVTGALTWLASPSRAAFQSHDLRLAEHLARRCALAVDNSRLYKEARAAVSIRDEFLSVAAHELKTPMTSLRGYAQLLAREFERGPALNPERARRAATTIQVQSDKLAWLVGQLLDVSRLQSGKLAIERKQSDLAELLRDVVETTRSQLKEHTLVASLPAEMWISIDPLRIEQVVTNLLDNAIKYSPGGGQIDVQASFDEATGWARIIVRDRGVGVPPEHRAHIFDRFYQVRAGGPPTTVAGMGLGLYISRQIVELHGGAIEAEFPAEGGTRLVVTLPCSRDDQR
ncbi:MAG TPA: ATP-binding protein, partial [Chloroflexota bacterium]